MGESHSLSDRLETKNRAIREDRPVWYWLLPAPITLRVWFGLKGCTVCFGRYDYPDVLHGLQAGLSVPIPRGAPTDYFPSLADHPNIRASLPTTSVLLVLAERSRSFAEPIKSDR